MAVGCRCRLRLTRIRSEAAWVRASPRARLGRFRRIASAERACGCPDPRSIYSLALGFPLEAHRRIRLARGARTFRLVQVVYYNLLGATRQHPGHSIIVFDLGAMSHFSKENVFPGTWTPEDSKLLVGGCYHPTAWDIYWTLEPCRFVMDNLSREGLFGSPALVSAWLHGIANHPLDYLRHRVAFMTVLLADAEFTMGTPDVLGSRTTPLRDGIRLIMFKKLPEFLTHTPLSRGGFWLLLDAVFCVFVLSRRNAPAAAFVLGVCGSAVVYTGSFLFVGVATDFRYHYWAVLAGLTGIIVAVRQRTRRLNTRGVAKGTSSRNRSCRAGTRVQLTLAYWRKPERLPDNRGSAPNQQQTCTQRLPGRSVRSPMCGRPFQRKQVSSRLTTIGCCHVSGLWCGKLMAAGPYGIRDQVHIIGARSTRYPCAWFS